MTSIVYVTSREEPCWQWFLDSLEYQLSSEEKLNDVELIFVDRLVDVEDSLARRHALTVAVGNRFKFRHVPPKDNVWQGSKRIVSQDWFAASNARNTGLLLAQGDFIAFVDDLSVLTGQYWKALKEARSSGKVTCGAYKKVRSLQVDNGNITHFDEFPQGVDNRFAHGNDSGPVPCGGHWLYGCSFACPVEFLENVNGSDEACDGMGFEDCILGIRLANAGYHFQYDRRMLTYESEERHHLDKVMRRTDKGVSPNDKSHAILKLANGTSRAENSHLGKSIRELREHYRETGEILPPNGPAHDWYDGQPIGEMT